MLKERLDMILSHIDGETVADIGTDHGYIPVQLALFKKAKKVIATDLNNLVIFFSDKIIFRI